MSFAQNPLVGRVLAETYRVERLLGEGGMGAVYLAGHTRLNKRFAIKTLHKEIVQHEEAYRRFRREAEIASELGHPHIIEVIDFDHTPDGIPYMVMEFLDGEDLQDYFDRVRVMPPEHMVPLFGEICSALAAAHERGVVHRDLKPQNIFLTRFGERRDFPKVLDFGISKIKGSGSVLTHGESFMGTPQYMAPEQAKGRAAEADARTDVFSLGAIAYRALSGKDAFLGDSIPQVLYLVVHEDPPPLHELVPSLPRGLCAAVHQAMRKRPEDRFSCAKAFGEALAAGLAGKTSRPSPAAPASAGQVSEVGTADTVLPGLTGPPTPHVPQIASGPAAQQAGTDPQARVARHGQASVDAVAVPPQKPLTEAVAAAPVVAKPVAIDHQETYELRPRAKRSGAIGLALFFVLSAAGGVVVYYTQRQPADPGPSVGRKSKAATPTSKGASKAAAVEASAKPAGVVPEKAGALDASVRPDASAAATAKPDASAAATAKPDAGAKRAETAKTAARKRDRRRPRRRPGSFRPSHWPKPKTAKKPRPKAPVKPKPVKPVRPKPVKPKPVKPKPVKPKKPGYGEGTMGFDS